jgi:hypothetical protein
MESLLPDIVMWCAAVLAVLPMAIFARRFLYWNAPEDVLSEKNKDIYFKIQSVAAIVLSIFTFVLLRDYNAYFGAWFERNGVILVPTIAILIPLYSFLLAPAIDFIIAANHPSYRDWRKARTKGPKQNR